MNNPATILEASINGSVRKTNLTFFKAVILSFMSGTFIAFGAAAANYAAHDISNAGVAKLVTGFVFPVGLMLVIVMGAELFTGNCLILMAVLDKRVSLLKLFKNLLIVYIGNFFGCILIAHLTNIAGQWNQNRDLIGAYTIKVAYGKISMSFGQAFASGILCNMLVCLAVLCATSSKDVAGKATMIFFVIMAFVLSGYEHSVANMYYLFAGRIASRDNTFMSVAAETYGLMSDKVIGALRIKNLIVKNLIPVTLGNLVGGMLFTALPFWFVYRKKEQSEK